MNHDQLARFTLSFGGFGDDPYVKSIEEHQNILEVRRDPDEDVAPFGGGWHSDWSFQETPPSATIYQVYLLLAHLVCRWNSLYAALDPTLKVNDDLMLFTALEDHTVTRALKIRPERSDYLPTIGSKTQAPMVNPS